MSTRMEIDSHLRPDPEGDQVLLIVDDERADAVIVVETRIAQMECGPDEKPHPRSPDDPESEELVDRESGPLDVDLRGTLIELLIDDLDVRADPVVEETVASEVRVEGKSEFEMVGPRTDIQEEVVVVFDVPLTSAEREISSETGRPGRRSEDQHGEDQTGQRPRATSFMAARDAKFGPRIRLDHADQYGMGSAAFQGRRSTCCRRQDDRVGLPDELPAKNRRNAVQSRGDAPDLREATRPSPRRRPTRLRRINPRRRRSSTRISS